MRSYDEAFAAAKDRRPFSNGTEGHAWTENWCEECVHDKSARDDDTPPDPRNNGLVGCPLLAVALMQRTPVEWIDQTTDGTHRLGDTYHCTEYRDDDPGDDGSPEQPSPPPPAAELEGQVDMFEVFADQIVEQVEQAQPVTA